MTLTAAAGVRGRYEHDVCRRDALRVPRARRCAPLRARFLLRLNSLAPVGDFSGAGDWPGAHLEPTPHFVGRSQPGPVSPSFPLVRRIEARTLHSSHVRTCLSLSGIDLAHCRTQRADGKMSSQMSSQMSCACHLSLYVVVLHTAVTLRHKIC